MGQSPRTLAQVRAVCGHIHCPHRCLHLPRHTSFHFNSETFLSNCSAQNPKSVILQLIRPQTISASKRMLSQTCPSSDPNPCETKLKSKICTQDKTQKRRCEAAPAASVECFLTLQVGLDVDFLFCGCGMGFRGGALDKSALVTR